MKNIIAHVVLERALIHLAAHHFGAENAIDMMELAQADFGDYDAVRLIDALHTVVHITGE